MASRETIIGYNPQNTEVSSLRRDRINELFPDAEETVRKGFNVIFGISEVEINLHGHEGSQATYFTEFNFGNDRFYASFIDEGEMTSKPHEHRWPAGRAFPREVSQIGGKNVDMTEEYYLLNIDGEVRLHLGKDGESWPPVTLDRNKPWEDVHSGTSHRVEGVRPSILIMKTRFGALVDPRELHIPVGE